MARLVVIGGTAAGLSAASKAKRMMPDLEVIVFEATGYVSYGACGLPYFASGLIPYADDLVSLTPAQLREKRGINIYTRHQVTKIDRTEKVVHVVNLKDGSRLEQSYDYLVIATGASPVVPAIPGINAQGVVTLRTVEDGIRLRNLVQAEAQKAVVIGGGLIGLETAEQLRLCGMQVHVVELQPHLLPFLPEQYSEEVLQTLQQQGIEVHLSSSIAAVETQGGRVTGVSLSNGDMLEADFALFSIGAAPNTQLAEDCGLALGLKKAIVVDRSMRTSDSAIWACGDCSQTYRRITGEAIYAPLGTNANKQGKVAGGSIAGGNDQFPGVLPSQVTELFGLCIAATGMTAKEAVQAGFDAVECSITKQDKASYYPGGRDNKLNLVFTRGDGQLLGAQGIGSEPVAGRINVLATAITAGMTVEQLNELDLVYCPGIAPVYDPILIAAAQAMKMIKK